MGSRGERSQGRGRGRGRKSAYQESSRTRHGSISGMEGSAKQALTEAGQLKQRAERQPVGHSAAALFEKSIESYQRALAGQLSEQERLDALFDMGEALLELAQSIMVVAQRTAKARSDYSAHRTAAGLYKQSHEAFEAVASSGAGKGQGGPGLATWQEAGVNSGNALTSWAEEALELPLEAGGGPGVAAELLATADQRYSAVLAESPEDLEALTNLADCLIRRAELAPEPDARALYERALSAYSAGCSKADSRLGDDLGGLLQNWGVGLASMAQRCSDPEESHQLFLKAEEKLRNACSFNTTDVTSRGALGEALTAHAEKAYQAGAKPEAYNLYNQAVEEGYAGAVKINAEHLDGWLGMADTWLTVSKLRAQDGDPGAAMEGLARAMAAYKEALSRAERGAEIGFQDKADALHNLACAGVLMAQEEEARFALERLVSLGATTAKELAEDPDLALVSSREWFQSLLARVSCG